MRIKRIFIYFLFLFFVSINAFAVDHYADLSDSGSTNAGTFAEPFKTIAAINAHSFAAGDDLYFKAATTHTMDERFNIDADWSGGVDADNPSYIGCYDGDGDFVCEGIDRAAKTGFPVLDANSAMPTEGSYLGLINSAVDTADFIYVKDIEVKNSLEGGIRFDTPDNITIDGCYIHDCGKAGITYVSVDGGAIKNNIIVETGTDGTSVIFEPMINVSGNWIDASCRNITISGNILYQTSTNIGEGIGLYHTAGPNIIVEKNVVYNVSRYALYAGSGAYENIFRYNLVYWTTDTDKANHRGISIGCESHACETADKIPNSSNVCCEDIQVYGNLIAGANKGISLDATNTCSDLGYKVNGALVYNNTIVESTVRSFNFINPGTGNIIKNNISWIQGAGDHVLAGNVPATVDFDYNLWSSEPDDADAKGANDPSYASAELSRASNWLNLPAGEVTGAEFGPTSASPAIDGTAADLGTSLEFVLIPGTLNYDDNPPTATAANADSYTWPYGAILGGLYISAGYPTSLQECTTDPRAVTFGVTSSANATCRFSVKGVDTCATAYASLDEEFGNTGARTAHTDTDETFACDNTDTLVVICNDGSYDSNCLEITVDVAGTIPPFPPPTGFGSGGNVSSGAGGNVTAGKP